MRSKCKLLGTLGQTLTEDVKNQRSFGKEGELSTRLYLLPCLTFPKFFQI